MGPGRTFVVHMVTSEIRCVLHRLTFSIVRNRCLIATDIPAILPGYHRSLHHMTELVSNLRRHSIPFQMSCDLISEWSNQPWLEGGGWEDLADLCSIEVDGWTAAQ